LSWGIWAMFHWHGPANGVTDLFVALAAFGAIMILRVEIKFLRQGSR
jgi:hypothetical protein